MKNYSICRSIDPLHREIGSFNIGSFNKGQQDLQKLQRIREQLQEIALQTAQGSARSVPSNLAENERILARLSGTIERAAAEIAGCSNLSSTGIPSINDFTSFCKAYFEKIELPYGPMSIDEFEAKLGNLHLPSATWKRQAGSDFITSFAKA